MMPVDILRAERPMSDGVMETRLSEESSRVRFPAAEAHYAKQWVSAAEEVAYVQIPLREPTES